MTAFHLLSVERKGKIPTGIASLSHSEAERDKKSEKQILPSGKIGDTCKETRVLLRVLTREVKIDIARYKTSKWQEFLSQIQETYDNTERAFWLHLSRVYKHRSLPFSKLDTGQTILTKENEITDEPYRYYEEQFKVQNIDISNPHDVQIETEYLELMNKLELSNEKIEMTNVREIKQHMSKMKPKKSSGFDQVSNFMIKRLPPSYISCLANCFNTWLREYRYPEVWKLAKIVMLNKLKAECLDVSRHDQSHS